MLFTLLLSLFALSWAQSWPQNFIVSDNRQTKIWVDGSKSWVRIQSGQYGYDSTMACFELGCIRYYIDPKQPKSNQCQTAVFQKPQFWDRVQYAGNGWQVFLFHKGLSGYTQTGPRTWTQKGNNRCGDYINQWNVSTTTGYPESWLSTARLDEADCVPNVNAYYYEYQAQTPSVQDFQDIILQYCSGL